MHEMTPEIKEMIELAAQAMGILGGFCDDRFLCTKNIGGLTQWNPLTSPADSHALMCELEISIIWLKDSVRAVCREYVKEESMYGGSEYFATKHEINEPYSTDKAAACRLAVLRVAAEIGKRKEKL